MKKTFKIMLLVFLGVVLIAGSAYAISGQCSNCHTMHYSQNGQVMGAGGGPFANLLKADCLGCHTESTSGNNPPLNSYGAPIVLHTTAPGSQGGGQTCAGGDFYWAQNTGDQYGHNVDGVKAADVAIGLTPPGWDTATPAAPLSGGQVNSGAAAPWGTQLRCAGMYGCHGNHTAADNMLGIKGTHHGNTGGTGTQASAPASIGGSYRFLAGIRGLENSEFNWNETASVHNEYSGEDNTSDRNKTSGSNYGSTDTISFSCAECHGYFHSRIDDDATSGTPWARHPTDIVLGRATGTEYSAYNPDGLPVGSGAVAGNTDYSIEAPVARPRTSIPATSGKDVDPATDIVMCLSCHRAHGSNQPDILRWSYAGIIAGSGTVDSGCFTCHTTKNAD
jgi:predicted CXXCH cytochrome family protein